jgi:hypothetical protein
MYNIEIYNSLKEKFGTFNMPLICDGIAHLYKLLYESGDKNAEFEHVWWSSIMSEAYKSINGTETNT